MTKNFPVYCYWSAYWPKKRKGVRKMICPFEKNKKQYIEGTRGSKTEQDRIRGNDCMEQSDKQLWQRWDRVIKIDVGADGGGRGERVSTSDP